MAEDFDQFAQQHSRNQEIGQQNRERLTQETKPEWAVPKGLVSRFALDSKEFGGHKFEWASYPGSRPEFLRLKDVKLPRSWIKARETECHGIAVFVSRGGHWSLHACVER